MTTVFGTTFLGHQGWLFQTEKARILVDPLLCEDFGAAHALGYRVWPPRRWTWEKLSPIDAVFLTHEHDDHFDLPSLAKLSRRIPIYLSARSSIAGGAILRELGFDVRPLVPGVPVKIGDLEVHPLAGDHVGTNCGDEWDTLPFLVKHHAGSMFSMVDITLTEGHIAWAKARVGKPGIVTWTNNALDWSHMAPYLGERVEGTQQTFVRLGTGRKLIETAWGIPAAMVMCAGGFAFEGERAWLNQRVFCVDNEAVCAAMQNLYKKERFFAGHPGQTWWMDKHKLERVDDAAKFLTVAPRAEWPSREKAATAIPDYAPATGRRELESEGELVRRLDELAGSLLGGATFRSLSSLLASESPKRATFALVLRDGDTRRAFAYVPTACRFEMIEDPDECLAGLECWASDFLAVLRGELSPIAMSFGRGRLWNHLPARFRFDLFSDLYVFSHPLRRPDVALRGYQKQIAGIASATPAIIEPR